MQTLKTAVVVVLLLVVFYGVYETLNRAPDAPPPAVADLPPAVMDDLEIDLGAPTASGLDATMPFAPPASQPNAAQAPVPAPPLDVMLPSSDASSASLGPPQVPGVAEAVAGPMPVPSEANTLAERRAAGPSASAVDVSASMGTGVATVPADPRLQHNPFFNEDVTPAPAAPQERQLVARAYQNARRLALSQIEDEDYGAALATLSAFFRSPDLTAEEHRELLDLLDPLAGRVVYSREHLLERPYTVRRNETLAEIAAQYQVPAELLQRINGIENPDVLLPGSELKVVPGPFRADVDLEAQELTLFLDRLYAGRFPITLGSDPAPMEGRFQVREKRPGKTFFSLDGRTIPVESPANPFGNAWLDLGSEVCIHGSPIDGGDSRRGCISLSPRDASDVYGILSVGSQVRILR